MRPAADSSREGSAARDRWLTHNLRVLSGVSLLQDAASELLYPIIPIFLTSVLGAPVSVVGTVEGIAEAVASGTKIAAGRIADRVHRKPLVAVGYGLAAVGKTVIACAFVWPAVLCGRAIDRVGKGIRGAPRDALLVEDIPAPLRGRAFGFHRTADTMGAVIGPLIGLAGYEALHHHIRPLLVIAVVPAVASVFLVNAVHEHYQPDATPAHREPAPSEPLPSLFWRVVGIVSVCSLINFPDALLLLRVKALGFSVAGVILVYVTYNAAYAFASYPAGLLADRFSPPVVFAFGLTCFAVCYLGLGVVTTGGWVWPLFIVYGGFTASTDGVGKAWVSRVVATNAQGRAQGLFQGLTGGAVLIAGVWAGFAWGDAGRLPLVVSGGVALLVAATLFVVGRSLAPAPHAQAAAA